MDLLEQPEIKKTYEKCKYIVKVWEHKFKKIHNRVPSKLDIREAESNVRHAYRKYFQLKSAALEQSFMDVDGFNSDEENSNPPEPVMESPKAPSPEPEPEKPADNTWGDHLNVSHETTSTSKLSDTTNKANLNTTITKKLFCGSKFAKRNPRKSFSQSQSQKKSETLNNSQSQNQSVEFGSFCSEDTFALTEVEESLLSLNSETIKVLLNSDHNTITQSTNLINALDQSIKLLKRVDSGWLERVAQSTGTSIVNPDLTLPPSLPETQTTATKVDYDSDDVIEGSDEELVGISAPSDFHIAKKIRSEVNNVEKKLEEVEESVAAVTQNEPAISESVAESCENLSEAEVPYDTEDDEEPEFLPGKLKKTIIYEFDSEDEVPLKPAKKKKLVKKKNAPNSKTKRTLKSKEVKVDEVESENVPYELEYCVKPRIVASRFGSIKRVLAKKKLAPPSDEPKGEIDEAPKTKTEQAKTALEKKVASGNLNENFVRINIQKKIFARGKKGMSFTKYKKSQWKSKNKALCGENMDMGGCDGGMLTCFKCGQIGHFARYCKAEKGEGLLPLATTLEEEDCPFPTLEEASQMAQDSVLVRRAPQMQVGDAEFEDDDEETEMLLAETIKLEEHVRRLDVKEYMDLVREVKPYFEAGLSDTPPEVYEALKLFGHSSFRDGQERAVMRILSGQSTLVTLSTGSGKSLCYQLPAYLYSQREPCISLIISPLVSLMEDQVLGIPSFLKAACLHTNQTKTQREKVMEAIALGNLNVLLISPEAVVAGEKQTGFGSLLRKLPPIAFACIDEAHCVSQWSHNFRPSYLMICRVLRESLGVKTILGLTATATRATSDSIIKHLDIPDGREGIISDTPLPDNLHLAVSRDAQRDHALLGLLLTERYAACKSIIVYCTRRDECERIASFLRTSLKSEKVVQATDKKRKRVNLQAEPYHAGLSASRRRTIQNTFMSGELRIVVATVAFGMGINKADIRSVIHFNMPNSFESYVQEIGRAGRDGLPAYCHLFLDSEGRDENELRRHIHANSIDRHVIRKLLQKIFVPCACKGECPQHEVAFSIEETVQALDIPEENISTLLCYLELHPNKYVKLVSPAYTTCKIVSYAGAMALRRAAKECAPLAMALAMHKSDDEQNAFEFPVVDVAAAMGWESGICKYKLKNLEWATVNNQPKRSSLTVRFSNLGFRLFAPGNLTGDQLDEALDSLYNRVVAQEKTALLQLRAVHQTLVENASKSYRTALESEDDSLKARVREYFNSASPLANICEVEEKSLNEEQLCNDIRTMVSMYRDNTFTGRAIARIFHGIQSPNYPAVMWGRCKFWRSHMMEDFHAICRIATKEILKMR